MPPPEPDGLWPWKRLRRSRYRQASRTWDTGTSLPGCPEFPPVWSPGPGGAPVPRQPAGFPRYPPPAWSGSYPWKPRKPQRGGQHRECPPAAAGPEWRRPHRFRHAAQGTPHQCAPAPRNRPQNSADPDPGWGKWPPAGSPGNAPTRRWAAWNSPGCHRASSCRTW